MLHADVTLLIAMLIFYAADAYFACCRYADMPLLLTLFTPLPYAMPRCLIIAYAFYAMLRRHAIAARHADAALLRHTRCCH